MKLLLAQWHNQTNHSIIPGNTLRSSSSPSEQCASSLAAVGTTGRDARLSAAMSSLCLLNLSTSWASLERLARITSPACVLQVELISKIVWKGRIVFRCFLVCTTSFFKLNNTCCSATYRLGSVAFNGVDHLKALQLHFLQTTPWKIT